MASDKSLNVQDFFSVELVDLGDVLNLEMRGILAPKDDLNRQKIGVTDQFLENANVYHEKYFDTAYFKSLLANALSKISFSMEEPNILDIGSGSGNTVIPALELFKGGRIIATDISENLLYILKRFLQRNHDYDDRVRLVCMDATRAKYYKENMVDLVIGAAILHHLIDPYPCIEAACTSLKKGGSAIFFEPFENGSSILRIAYTEIVEKSKKFKFPWNTDLNSKASGFLKKLIDDFAVRAGTDKSNDLFQKIDDKWLFTKKFFHTAAKKCNLSNVTIYPLHDTAHQFRKQTETYLRLGLGAEPGALPNWAWEILDYYDNLFSPDLKDDLLIEGAIILTK